MDTPEPAARRLSTVERAYELARDGSCRAIDEIARQLKQERYDNVDAHLGGNAIRRDLRQLCAEARTQRLSNHEDRAAAE
ncbi:MAG TPA: hypothetical protein VF603_15255 [Allosphingosinicella sp.]|jgi:hypothetical protein